MTDIVERLYEEERLHRDGLGFGLGPAGLCQEAAEEIQRLREALAAALEDILDSDDNGAIRIIQVALAERVGDLTEASHSRSEAGGLDA